MLLATTTCPIFCARSSWANGGKAKQQILLAQRGSVRLEAAVDPILFVAASLRGKYKVLRIRIINRGEPGFD